MTKSIADASEFEIGYAIGFLSAKHTSFSTIDIIRQITGSYQVDASTPAGLSPNALFGKRLSENSSNFRIRLVQSNEPSQDDYGNKTTTAIWCLV